MKNLDLDDLGSFCFQACDSMFFKSSFYEHVPLSSHIEVDVEGMEFTPGEMDSVGSASDADDHYSLGSGSSDSSYSHSRRLSGRLS